MSAFNLCTSHRNIDLFSGRLSLFTFQLTNRNESPGPIVPAVALFPRAEDGQLRAKDEFLSSTALCGGGGGGEEESEEMGRKI